jgi:hypothetical protein
MPEAAAAKVKSTVKKARTRWQTISHAARFIIFGVVLLLVVARLAAPTFVERYVNRTLDRHPEYGGQIGQVHLHLLRGAYSIDHVDVVKKSGETRVPFVSAKRMEFSVEWRELVRGSLVSEITVDQARLNFIHAPTEEESQTGIQKSWVGILEDLFPFRINRCTVRRSEVWYHDFHSNPQVHVYLTNMLMVATNLSNVRQSHQELPAAFQLRGTTVGQGDVRLLLRANPLAEKPTFDLNAAVTNMDLTALNDFLRAYAKADVAKGRIDVFAEMAASEGRFEGYIKPLVYDLKVFNTQDKNAFEIVWEAIVAFLAQTFKNHPNDQFGTKIPFSGNFDNPKVNVWDTIVNVLRNTFIKALQPGVEGSVSPDKVREDAGKAPPGKKK